MRDDIQNALFGNGISGPLMTCFEQIGDSDHGAVSALACEAVASAINATQIFCEDAYGQLPTARIDKGLVDLWCSESFVPDGWTLPPKWDPHSGDYQTVDGWIRLHCNASHHRQAALHVLGNAISVKQVQSAVLTWRTDDLEEAIVSTGGCVATLRNVSEWRGHPQGKAVAAEPIIAWNRSENAPSHWRPKVAQRPLQGLRILDLTRIIAGPVATRFLASLGADVVRIDPPGWSEGANEVEMTLGKSCAELDLKKKNGHDIFVDLLRSADVLVYGYRKDALPRLGINPKTLTEVNPSLITVGLNAYGWTGPWRNRRGFDSLVQRSTGLAVDVEGQVIDLPYQVLDHATGYLMAAATVEAVRRQITKNEVSHARLSLARQAMTLLQHGVDASNVPYEKTRNPMQIARQTGQKELTGWGSGWRCPLPYQIEGSDLSWSKPAHKLRSDPPKWSNPEARI